MTWQLIIQPQAYVDLQEIYDYVAGYSSAAADKMIQQIMKAIDDLDTMPQIHSRCHLEPWSRQNVRQTHVRNYTIFFWPDKSNHQVKILRVVSSYRDLHRVITQTPAITS